MNVSLIAQNEPLYKDALDLRYDEFFKPYNLPREVTADDMESSSIHAAITEDQNLIAYGRLSPLGNDEYRISQIVVAPGHRGKGISVTLLKLLINEAKNRNATRIRLGAQLSAQDLYKKLGFEVVSESYTVELTGVVHVKMELKV